MAVAFSADWGPYRGPADAKLHLCAFVDAACAPDVGIVWAANGVIFPLRAPRRDGQGIGDVVVFEWTRLPPPPPKPASGFGASLQRFIARALEAQGRAAIAEGEANMAMARSVNTVVDRMIHSHQDDAAGVALDVVCIVLSLALLPTGIGALGILGLAGGAVLLLADGAAYTQEMSGDEEGAISTKERTESIRIVATVMTLPDVVLGGFRAVRELQEIRELRALDTTTAQSAETLAAKTQRASRAAIYAQIAERAHLRAQIRTQQIMAAMRLEIMPRGAGAGSVSLLIREEMLSDESALHQFFRRIRVHCTAVRQ